MTSQDTPSEAEEPQDRLVLRRVIDAPAPAIFDVLADPARHPEIDGSQMVAAAIEPQRIQAVGDVFVIDMRYELRDLEYTMFNHVSAFEEGVVIAWKPARASERKWPGGWVWRYDLAPAEGGGTEVTLTYDWSRLRMRHIKSRFPVITADQLEQSLENLDRLATAD